MPAQPLPRLTRVISLREATSYTNKSPVERIEINTRLPSGVNFRRLAPFSFASIDAVTFRCAVSIIQSLPSLAAAVQSSFQSGDTSKPSVPNEVGIVVTNQSRCAGPGGAGCVGSGGIRRNLHRRLTRDEENTSPVLL